MARLLPLLALALLAAAPPATAAPSADPVVHRYEAVHDYGRTWQVAAGDQDAGLRCRDCGTSIRTPFPVTVFGVEHDAVYVTASGTAQFGEATTTAPAPTAGCLPDSAFQGPVLLPLWDDLDTSHTPGGGVFSGTSGSAPHRVLSVEWRHAFSATDHGWHDFSLSIEEGTGLVTYDYGAWGFDPDAFEAHAAYGVVGAQDAGGAVATGYSCRRGIGANSGVELRPTTGATVASRPLGAQASGDTAAGAGTLTWQPPALTGGGAVTGYYVYLNQDQGSQRRSPLLSADDRTFMFRDLVPGMYCWLSVAAVNAAGESLPSATRLLDVVPPAPAGRAAATATHATLTWEPPAAVQGPWVTGYRVTRNGSDLDGNGPVSVWRAPAARTQDFGRLRPGTRYTLTVQALAAAGPGAVSTVRLTIPGTGQPGAPRIGAAVVSGARRATVSWTPPVAGTGTAVTGYRVRALRLVDGRVVEGVPGPLLPAGTRSSAVPLPRPGTWCFSVVGVAVGGAGPASTRSGTVGLR